MSPFVDPGEDIPGTERWWSHTAAEALDRLGSGPEGLSTEEARSRLERHGPNVIRAEEVEPW